MADTDRIRSALRAAADREQIPTGHEPVVARARRRLVRNGILVAVVLLALVAGLSTTAASLRVFDEVPSDGGAFVPSVIPDCCLPTEPSIVFASRDGSVSSIALASGEQSVVIHASRLLSVTADGHNVLEITSDHWLGIYPGGHAFVPIVQPAPADMSGATISPDARRIAYASGGALFVRRAAEGSQPRQIDLGAPGAASSPAWSPDGTTIAFAWTVEGRSSIALLDIATGQVTPLLADAVAPSWAPDGQRLVVARPRDNDVSQIEVVDLAGETTLLADGGEGAPTFSPAGDEVAFLRGGRVVAVGMDAQVAWTLPIEADVATSLFWVRGAG